MKQIERHKHQQSTKHTSHFSGKAKLRDAGGGSHSEKREWEVGQKVTMIMLMMNVQLKDKFKCAFYYSIQIV